MKNMIERTNPYKSCDGKSLRKAKETASRILIGGILAAMLFTMSGCGKKATEALIPFNEGDSLPDSAIVFYMDDGTYYVDGTKMVKFKDKAFREEFDGEDVDYYMLSLEKYISLYGPKSLDELMLLQNLETLNISDCDLEDLSIISKLTNLKNLSLSDCDNVTDLSFLLDMELESLSLTDMAGIDDLSFVGEISTLKELTIDNCDGCDIDVDAISKLDLTELDLSFMDVENLDFLQNMHNLETLSISYSNLKDINGIRNLKNLTGIYLTDCLISDASVLYGMEKLEYIDISNNSIDSFDISKFPNLKYLRVSYNFALYTDEFLDYCESHEINVDITREDVQCMNQVRDIIKELELDGLSDAEKEAKIYAYVLANMKYDKKGLKDDDLVADYNERALYHALQGKGVCATYAAFFDALCDAAGIDAFHVSGYAKTGLFNLSGGPHAWVLVEVDGQYMLCDPTWSDTIRDSFDYKVLHLFEKDKTDKYFNASGDAAERFKKDHMEGAYDRGDKKDTPRSDEAISIETTDENGEKISGAVLTGMITGSVVLLGGTGVGIACHSAKKKRERRERQRREAEARRRSSSSRYGNSYY